MVKTSEIGVNFYKIILKFRNWESDRNPFPSPKWCKSKKISNFKWKPPIMCLSTSICSTLRENRENNQTTLLFWKDSKRLWCFQNKSICKRWKSKIERRVKDAVCLKAMDWTLKQRRDLIFKSVLLNEWLKLWYRCLLPQAHFLGITT